MEALLTHPLVNVNAKDAVRNVKVGHFGMVGKLGAPHCWPMRVSYPVCACNLISRIPGCASWEQTSDPSEVRALVPFLFVQGGLTPLHLAAIHGHVPVLLALLKHPKIDVNAEDNVRKGAGHELSILRAATIIRALRLSCSGLLHCALFSGTISCSVRLRNC